MLQALLPLAKIALATKADELVTAAQANAFVWANVVLLRSLDHHTKAWRRCKDNNGIAVEGDIFLESQIDAHNHLR